MADIPNLAGVATQELVEQIGGGNFKASYINWSRTLNLLRTHAPGWLPELVANTSGSILHEAPVGAFLLIRFRHADGTTTPEVPQAVMDTRNAAIPAAKITARDITDTHRRGVCLAAALTFGLAYELWAKVALESGYGEQESAAPAPKSDKVTPLDGAWDAMDEESKEFLTKVADYIKSMVTGDKPTDPEADSAHAYIAEQQLTPDEKAALWTRLPSNIRSALKRAHDRSNKEAA